MGGEKLYDDGLVTMGTGGITLRRYYFPLPLPKRIPYRRIRRYQARKMGMFTGQIRLWGTGDLRHWWPLDARRASKDVAIQLDIGRFVRPCFSPDYPDTVTRILREQVPAAAFDGHL